MTDPWSAQSAKIFRRQVGFLGVIGVAFTGQVYLMTLLRPVLEPFLWALFLVMALHPLAHFFERCLLGIGGLICRHPKGRTNSQQRCLLPQRSQGGEMGSTANVGEGDESDEFGFKEPRDVESVCWTCYACFARVVAVMAALSVVMGIAFGVCMMIFDAVVRVQTDWANYRQGAKDVQQNVSWLIDDLLRDFFARIFGDMEKDLRDSITDNALDGVKALAQDLLAGLTLKAGKIVIEFLMLALYLLFWLCTPMPLNQRTEQIFRRYLFLKGGACICYGVSVGVTLALLKVELAVVFGLMSFFLCFIPEVGAFLAMLLPVPVILFDHRHGAPWGRLLVATACQLTLKFVFANIIEVKLVEHDATMKMHPVITLLAVAFFGFTWGPTGMLLSVPLMAYLKVVILSDVVPPLYRDPVLILLEGDPRAPERHAKQWDSDSRH